MASTVELFRCVVETVFNNWTALRLAVEHGMGGHQSKETALQLINHVVEMFCKENTEVEDIADFLIDFMDTEFQTLCEDNSPDEVASVLWQFYQHCKIGNRELIDLELNKLPKCEVWLSKTVEPITSQEQVIHDGANANGSENTNDCVVMEAEEEMNPEWTHVRSRRRK